MTPSLPSCQYRLELGNGLPFFCRHSAVRSRENTVIAADCVSCTMRTVQCYRPREVPIVPSYHPQDHFQSLPGKLAVLTCYFNPCGYQSLKRNYLRFAAGLRERSIPLYSMELAFDDRPFFLEPREQTLRVRAEDVLWQKERMLNQLLKLLPTEFDKVAWIDADLIFTNPHWAGYASRMLGRYPVIQLFEQAELLTKEGGRGGMRNGVAYAVARGFSDARHLGKSHPGFAWAARRELLDKHGLLDNNIIGGADSIMVHFMFGWMDSKYMTRYGESMFEAIMAWGRPFWNDVRSRVGYVPGRVLHMWHGSRENRRYNDRIDWLRQHDFDPHKDIISGPDGLWRWASRKAALHERIRRYFYERREDD